MILLSEFQADTSHYMGTCLWVKTIIHTLLPCIIIPVDPGIGLIFHIKQVRNLNLKGNFFQKLWIKCIGDPHIIDEIRIQNTLVRGSIIDKLLTHIP